MHLTDICVPIGNDNHRMRRSQQEREERLPRVNFPAGICSSYSPRPRLVLAKSPSKTIGLGPAYRTLKLSAKPKISFASLPCHRTPGHPAQSPLRFLASRHGDWNLSPVKASQSGTAPVACGIFGDGFRPDRDRKRDQPPCNGQFDDPTALDGGDPSFCGLPNNPSRTRQPLHEPCVASLLSVRQRSVLNRCGL